MLKKKDELRKKYSNYVDIKNEKFCWRTLNVRDYVICLDLDGRIMLKWICEHGV